MTFPNLGLEIIRGKGFPVVVVGKMDRSSIYLNFPIVINDTGIGVAGISIDGEPRWKIDKLLIRGVFQPNQIRCDDREPGVACHGLTGQIGVEQG